jgi:hypothetical protein
MKASITNKCRYEFSIPVGVPVGTDLQLVVSGLLISGAVLTPTGIGWIGCI